MNWVSINLPWRLSWSKEMQALNKKFVDAVNAAKQEWRNQFPSLHLLEANDPAEDRALSEGARKALDVQDQFPWASTHLKAENIHTWQEEALQYIHAMPEHLRVAFTALVKHRYAYVLQNKYIDTHADVLTFRRLIEELRVTEHYKQFCNHALCKVGVQIEVQDKDGVRKMLIGDTTKDGNEDGCCSAGLRDEDIILRARDFSKILESDV